MTRIIVEADGGSRGNPGPAAFGALIRDASTGEVLGQRGETIGTATNNVAEYSGLIAGLELAREHEPGADVEVRMDSKLVIEQMAGRWKIKHPGMKPLALKAQQIVRDLGELTWTWVPRAENKAADALVNAALDAKPLPSPKSVSTGSRSSTGWSARQGEPTTLILVRHGVTTFTERKVFSGSGKEDPELTELGHRQAERAADWIAHRGPVDAVVASPLRRTQQTAAAISGRLGVKASLEPSLMEVSFGDWDGFTFAEIHERWPTEMRAWLASTAVAPPGGGEAFDDALKRVTAGRDRLLTEFAGQTVVAATHVTPIKILVGLALGAPLESIYRMELAPASISVVSWWADGPASLRSFNIVP